MKYRRATIPMTLQNYTPILRVSEPPKVSTTTTVRIGMFQNLQNIKPCGSCGKR